MKKVITDGNAAKLFHVDYFVYHLTKHSEKWPLNVSVCVVLAWMTNGSLVNGVRTLCVGNAKSLHIILERVAVDGFRFYR